MASCNSLRAKKETWPVGLSWKCQHQNTPDTLTSNCKVNVSPFSFMQEFGFSLCPHFDPDYINHIADRDNAQTRTLATNLQQTDTVLRSLFILFKFSSMFWSNFNVSVKASQWLLIGCSFKLLWRSVHIRSHWHSYILSLNSRNRFNDNTLLICFYFFLQNIKR